MPVLEVEDVFVTVVDEAPGVYWLKVAHGVSFARAGLDADRLDPVKGVLEMKKGIFSDECEEELVGKEGILGDGPDIQKKGAIFRHHPPNFGGPLAAPSEEIFAVPAVIVGPIIDPDVVRRRGHYDIDTTIRHRPHSFEAVLLVEIDHRETLR